MLCWSLRLLLLGAVLIAAATQDTEEIQKEEQHVKDILTAGPGPPLNIVVTPVGNMALNVSWDPPEVPPEHYTVEIFLTGFNEVADDTFFLIEKLDNCTTYIITVSSVYSSGQQYYNYISGTTNTPVLPPPEACQFTPITSSKMTVSWHDPDIQCDKDKIVNHSISLSLDVLWSDEEWSYETFSAEPSITLSNLSPYTNITASIAVINTGGVGLPTTCGTVTPEADPGPPIIVEVTASAGSVVVSWTPPDEANGIIIEYMINAESEEDSVSTSVAGTVLTSVVEDLQGCQTYNITVRARTVAGWGPESEVWNITVSDPFPLPPEICWFSNITDTKMVINWIDPVTQCGLVNNHSISWSWDVLWTDEQGSNVTFSQDTSITLTDLPPYTNVTAQVAAATAGGFGPPTSCWNVTSPDKMFDIKSKADVSVNTMVVMQEELPQTVV